MRCTTYSRLGITSKSIAETSGSFYLNGQIDAPEALKRGLPGKSQHVLPFHELSSAKVFDVKDPFMEREVTADRNDLYHCKLPESYNGCDERILNRRVHDDGYPSDWTITTSPIPHMTLTELGTGSFGWWYTPDGDNAWIVVRYWGSISPLYWWSNLSPWVDVSGDTIRISMDANGRVYYQQPRTNPNCNKRYYNVSDPTTVDDVFVRSTVRNFTGNDWGPPQYYGQVGYWYDVSGGQPLPPMATLFDEPNRFMRSAWGPHQYEFEWLTQHAFYDACSDIGRANENMIQNLVEMTKFLWNVSNGNFRKVLENVDLDIDLDNLRVFRNYYVNHGKSSWKIRTTGSSEIKSKAGGLWLKYRYVYSTGKADYTQLQKFLLTKCENYLNFLNSNYYKISYGFASRAVDGVNVECRCKLAWRPRILSGFKAAFKYLHEWGLEVNPYVLWDFIPGSFIADWFFPVGDTLEVVSNAKYYTAQYYDFNECSFSVSYSMDGHNNDVGHRYYRWYTDPPFVDGWAWLDKAGKSASAMTLVKRAIDTGAISSGLTISSH